MESFVEFYDLIQLALWFLKWRERESEKIWSEFSRQIYSHYNLIKN